MTSEIDRSSERSPRDRVRVSGLRPGAVAALLLGAAMLLPSTALAQQGQQNRQQIVSELREVNRQLQQIRRRVMQDTALQDHRDSVRRVIRDRMRSISDSAAERVDRLAKLEEEMRAARQARDTARMQELRGEARSLNRSLQGARRQAMADSGIQERVRAFQEAVRQKMRQADSATDSLISRADSLRSLLQGGGAGRGG